MLRKFFWHYRTKTKINDKILIQGIIDVLFQDENSFVLIDYKTDHIIDGDSAATINLKQKYKLQIDLYAEAIETILKKSVSQKFLYMLSGGLIIPM